MGPAHASPWKGTVMSTRTLRGLAAGAGAAAVLFAGAAGASANQEIPQPGPFEVEAEERGYVDVTCSVDQVTGNQSALYLTEEDHGAWLDEGEVNVLLVLKSANQYDYFWDPQYGDLDTNVYRSSIDKNITHTILCKGTADDDDDDDNGVTPGDGDETDEPTETEDPTDDGDDKDKDDDKDDKPTGPPVETDGPATPSGPNMGLMGGAALLLGGAGAAGWAMRRRAGEH